MCLWNLSVVYHNMFVFKCPPIVYCPLSSKINPSITTLRQIHIDTIKSLLHLHCCTLSSCSSLLISFILFCLVKLVLLSLLILLALELNMLSLLVHFVDHVPIELLLIVEPVSTLFHANQALRLFTLCTRCCTALWPHTNVFGYEVLCSEILHVICLEIVGIDVIFWRNSLSLFNDLFKLITNEISDVLESFRHAHLILGRLFQSLRKLFIEFAGNFRGPVCD